MSNKQADVFFSVAQLQYLETLFPQVVFSPSASVEAMRHYFGQQDVVQAVRRRTRGLNGTTNARDTESIPSPAG